MAARIEFHATAPAVKTAAPCDQTTPSASRFPDLPGIFSLKPGDEITLYFLNGCSKGSDLKPRCVPSGTGRAGFNIHSFRSSICRRGRGAICSRIRGKGPVQRSIQDMCGAREPANRHVALRLRQ